ncbi:MAG: SDR family oxidoreductase [Chloroflexi bacterium]|nr:SDR family oxidoreductase [Chloroflexota bacterium]
MPDDQERPMMGRVALVTGAASGIGRATARRMAQAGASVVVVDVDEPGGTKTVADLREEGLEATFVPADVTSEEQVRGMFDATLERYGRLDVLHNNAGIMPVHQSIEETSLEVWRQVIDIDLTGVFLGCKYGVPALKRSGGGVILNTASLAGIRGFAYGLHYAAAKGGVVQMTISLANLLSDDGIRVNCICPTAVDTPLTQRGSTETRAATLPRYRNIRTGFLQPEDIARGALYLATKADFTGGALIIDRTPKGRPKYFVAFEYKWKRLTGV